MTTGPKLLRAAIYARVSSQAQRDAHTIENQLRVLPAFVAAQGWELVATYVDDGRSAKAGKLDARDGFAALLRDAEARRFDLLVVVDVDRLTRTDSIEERARILGPFQRLGIDIVTPSGGRLDTRTMFGELWITIQALGAAEENRKRAERIKAGKARAIAEGRKPAGPTPYGWSYERATGAWSLDAPAAATTREIFHRVAGGEACSRIAVDLDLRPDGRRPRTGWSHAAVYRIVRSRTPLGEWFADKRLGAMVRIPAIVTEGEWQAAQRALLAHKRRGLRKTKHVYLLEGIARCGACGSPIAIRSACGRRKDGSRNPAAYVCRARKLDSSCAAPIVRCADLDDRIWAALCDELAQPELAQALADADRDDAGVERDWRSDAEGHRAHLARLEKVEAAVMVRFRRGQISEGALDLELAGLGKERSFVRDQLAASERALRATRSDRDRLRAAGDAVAQLRAALPKATPEQRRALLRELAHDSGVVVTNGRARLDLRLIRAVGSLAVDASIAHVESAGYRMSDETIVGPALRIRRVA